MKKIVTKIKNLEEEIRDDFKWGSTQIDPKCLTEAEKKLVSHIYEMDPPIELNPADAELFNKISFSILNKTYAKQL